MIWDTVNVDFQARSHLIQFSAPREPQPRIFPSFQRRKCRASAIFSNWHEWICYWCNLTLVCLSPNPLFFPVSVMPMKKFSEKQRKKKKKTQGKKIMRKGKRWKTEINSKNYEKKSEKRRKSRNSDHKRIFLSYREACIPELKGLAFVQVTVLRSHYGQRVLILLSLESSSYLRKLMKGAKPQRNSRSTADWVLDWMTQGNRSTLWAVPL